MLLGIVGFRIPIARIEGKFKLSQNRKPEERRNVQAAHAAGSPDQQALARWMERLADPPSSDPGSARRRRSVLRTHPASMPSAQIQCATRVA